MENELAIDFEQIFVVQGSIKFNEYEKVKQQAIALAVQIAEVEVSEDNIKQSKKLLAAVNKRLKELEDKRITIKKVMLEPYQLFEDQVKEITKIVRDADTEVRNQVRYLEEFERLQKEEAIKEIFEKRKNHYALGKMIAFEDFLQPKYLNKTASLTAIENEMVAFFERTDADLKVIETMPAAQDLLSAYLVTFNLTAAIAQVNDQNKLKAAVEASGALKKPAADKIAYLVSVTVYNQKELKLLEMLLKENDYEFTTDKISSGGI